MIVRTWSNLARWMRGNYPIWAPRRGHIPLVALCGVEGPRLEWEPESST